MEKDKNNIFYYYFIARGYSKREGGGSIQAQQIGETREEAINPQWQLNWTSLSDKRRIF